MPTEVHGLGPVHVEVLVGVSALGWAWLRAWRRRGQAPVRQSAALFGAALVVVLVAVNGPLDELSEHYLFSAHMVQHLVLTLGLPPLLLGGMPPWMMDGLLERPLGARVIARAVRRLVQPVTALSLYTIALVGWHLPGPYDAALASRLLHGLEHLTLVAASLVGWWPVVSPATLLPRLPYGGRILYLFVFGMPMTIVAAMITGADTLLYRSYAAVPRIAGWSPFEDQRLGGIIMWVPAGLVPLTAFTIVFFRWVAAELTEPSETPGSESP